MSARPVRPDGLRDLDEVIKELAETCKGCTGVQGFSLTVRHRLATMNLSWGDLKIRKRRKAVAPPPPGDEAEGAKP